MSGRRQSNNFVESGMVLVFRAIFLIATISAGCAAPKPVYTVHDSDPTAHIPAIRIAVEKKDLTVLPALVKDLDSDDPAVRLYANDGLRKLTNQNFGYLYYADDQTREPAVARWKAWLAANDPSGATTHALSTANPSAKTAH